MQWATTRRRTSAFSRWMDRLFDRQTTNARRAASTLKRFGGGKTLTEEDRAQLKQRYAERLAGMRSKRVVFFGDGGFSSVSRGSVPIAKKALLKLLCVRGPTVWLDEGRTSLMCPCGHSELRNPTKTELSQCPHLSDCRTRCHTIPAGSCPLATLQQAQQQYDRDQLACINMLHLAQCGLMGIHRPEFLCRQNQAVHDEAVAIEQ